MSRKTKEEAQKTRSRILSIALSLFTSKGYDDTTLNDIAARMKMTKGAVYWHFNSKEELLSELVRLALQKFQSQFEEVLSEGELTFPAVAEMLVKNAEQLVTDNKAIEFFRLMKCQIRWTDASMESIRQDLLNNETFSPKEAFRRALVNDVQAGRAKATIDVEEVSSVAITIWSGMVQAQIDHFLKCDMKAALEHSFAAIWAGIKI